MAFGISASPLSCGCSLVTISATEIQDTPSRWGVFLFYKAVYTPSSGSVTPFYSAPITGDLLNPSSDTHFDVTLPCNALYTFYSFAIKPFDLALTYGLSDWSYNPIDGKIYISKAGSNIGHALDNQVWWRQLNKNDYENVSLKLTNVLSTSLERDFLTQNVTGNTKFSGLGVQIKKNLTETSRTCLALTDRTGNFSIDCNPYGYGGVNPFRGDYAYMAILTNTKSDGTFSELKARPYSYRSSLEYRFDVPRDALYVLNVFMVQLFVADSSYNVKTAVFEAVSNKFYVSLVNNNEALVTDTDKWIEITSFASFSASIVYKTLLYYYVFDVNAHKMLYDLKEGVRTSCPCGCSGSSKCGSDLMQKYDFVLASIQNACFAKELGRMEEAQCFLEKIPKNCSPYISAFKC